MKIIIAYFSAVKATRSRQQINVDESFGCEL